MVRQINCNFDPHQKFIYLLSIIITLLLIPVLVVVFIPLLIYRNFVSLLWTIFNYSDGKIIGPTSSTCAVDDILTKPTCSVVVTLESEIDCDPADLLVKMSAKLQNLLDSGRYSELKCYLATCMGFSFWKQDPNFNIQNHFHLIEHPMSQSQLDIFKQDLVQKPYERNKALWDFTCITKIDDHKTVILLRIHHSLADGQSILKLLSQLRNNPEPWTQRSSDYSKKSKLKAILFFLKVIFCGPTDLIYALLKGQDKNAWKLSQYSKNLNCAESKQIPLSDFKKIAKAHSVSVTSVLLAGLTGAIRNMMLKYDSVKGQDEILPSHMTIICPFPLPGHPDELTNHMTMVPVRVPLNESNSILRINKIEEELHQLKKSTLPLIFSYGIKLIGSLPRFLIASQSKGGIGTAALSNFPGPDTAGEICGYIGSDLKIMAGIAHGMLGVNCGVISYNGNVQISVGIDEAIFSDKMIVHEFLQSMLQEFRFLSDSISLCDKYIDTQVLNLRKLVVV